MMNLANLANTSRPKKNVRRVGRGPGSKRGKTCGRGNKGDKSRRGFINHFGLEGGQMPLYKKSPTRGFSNERFRSDAFAVNLGMIDKFFKDGEVVSLKTLQEKKMAPRRAPGIKILSNGELKKRVTVEASAFSQAAQEKLKKSGITFLVVPINKSAPKA